MVQGNNPNIELEWPFESLEFTRELWVSATAAFLLAQWKPGMDMEKEMKDCMKDARARVGKMLMDIRNRAKQ